MSVTPEENTAEDPLNTDSLSEEAKASFEQAKSFCKGEYEGDTASLQSVMGEDAMASVTITPEVGADLTQKVLESYIKVLKDGGMSYVPADTGHISVSRAEHGKCRDETDLQYGTGSG